MSKACLYVQTVRNPDLLRQLAKAHRPRVNTRSPRPLSTGRVLFQDDWLLFPLLTLVTTFRFSPCRCQP